MIGDSAYTPMMSPEDVERITKWHRQAEALARSEAAAEPAQTFDYLGLTLVVPPEVMPITRVSHTLGNAVLAEVRDGDRVLDMGTGSGVNGILAATKGAYVVAVDINPYAVAAAIANAERNGVADRMDVRHGDVFSTVDGAFDVIVFDPPFRWFAPGDVREMASTDENYRAMTAFFRDARAHLTESGRMLIFFGTSGDIAYLCSLADAHAFACEVVAENEVERDGVTVHYYTHKMTPIT
ncbi:MAG TPA: methyltransferase [Micromonosporaceae bacterium]|nr:methyltransferase [Micromonosporaceae bacterium]